MLKGDVVSWVSLLKGDVVSWVSLYSDTIAPLLPIGQPLWRCWTWSLQPAARSLPGLQIRSPSTDLPVYKMASHINLNIQGPPTSSQGPTIMKNGLQKIMAKRQHRSLLGRLLQYRIGRTHRILLKLKRLSAFVPCLRGQWPSL